MVNLIKKLTIVFFSIIMKKKTKPVHSNAELFKSNAKLMQNFLLNSHFNKSDMEVWIING